MPELPASVRLALWATAELSRGGTDFDRVVANATPDLDAVDGAAAVARLDLWAQLGERMVLVSLPTPGDLVGTPRGGAEFWGLVAETGECVWSPLLGGALVPVPAEYGPPGDEGTGLRWEVHDCTPPPAHQLDLASPSETERALQQTLLEAVRALEDLDVPAWDAGLRDLAEERLGPGRWGLPDGIDTQIRRVLTRAATLGSITATASQHLHDAPSLAAGAERTRILREVERQSRHALASAACAAARGLAQG